MENGLLCSEPHLDLFRKKDETGKETHFPIKVLKNEQVGR